MTIVLNCQSLKKSFGAQTLFTDLSLSIFSGDRIGLIGPNGSGKSTLLKILAGQEFPDAGTVSLRKDLRVGYVPQTNEFRDAPPLQILLESFGKESFIPDYERVTIAETLLSKLGFTGNESSAAKLSGGWKKRLAIAKALLEDPDLLLLDEPTNHLDLEGILWLEKFLLKEVPTFFLISHDRVFLNNLTTKIIEINRVYPKGLIEIDGSYENFLEKKELFLEGQLEQERSIAGKARRETEWLRTSPKARTTKSESRIAKAGDILAEHADLQSRNKEKRARIQFVASERQSEKLLVGKNLQYEINGRTLFTNLDITLAKGSRVGLMGPNGSGKTTLLRVLAGELSPTQGTIKSVEDLKIVYFDQHRAKIPLDTTLKDALAPNSDHVIFQGRPVHVNGWCKRFLFSPEYLGMPIRELSGGERARIAIANLMLEPADLLFLDEPTNDLDIPTLEILEESLTEFSGAVVLITHDRCMLERLCNSFLALGDPSNTSFYAEYDQWERSQKKQEAAPKSKKTEAPTPQKKSNKKECDKVMKTISDREKDLSRLNESLATPDVQNNPDKLAGLCKKIAEVEQEIERLFAEWESLDT